MKNKNFSRPKKTVPINKVVNKVIRTLDSQVAKKVLTTSVANSAYGSVTGTLYTPALPSQGVTSSTRTGDSLHIDLIQFRMDFENATNGDAMRVVIVQAMANNVPTLASIFDNGASGSLDVTSFINYYARDKEFIVLHDSKRSVCFESSKACSIVCFDLNPKISKINFSAGSTTAEAGQIYIAVFSTTGVDTSYFINQRLIFHDL